jgi:hypothetical protein
MEPRPKAAQQQSPRCKPWDMPAPKGRNSRAQGVSPGIIATGEISPIGAAQAACAALAGLIVYAGLEPRVPEPAIAGSFTLGFAVPRFQRSGWAVVFRAFSAQAGL